jgi:hypothetical protein
MKTFNSHYGSSTATPAYSDGDIGRVTNNLLPDNLNWGLETLNDSLRYLTTKYYFNERSYTTVTSALTQFYNLPPQVKKLINVTVFIGSTLWQPKECPSREYWDYLNTQTFNQDYPSFFFVYNGQVGLWPVPASNGNTITMNYKTRIVDLAMPDVTNATASSTVSITTNTTTVTASGATFKQWMAGQWIRIPFSSTDSANGDNQWYQIDTITSGTVLALKNKYSGATVTAANFTIGQTPLLPEDYQDLPLYRMGYIYYTTRFPDPTRAKLYSDLYDKGAMALDDEFGSKTTSVILPDTAMPIYNPNVFQSGLTKQ